jgi:hypothetical protein
MLNEEINDLKMDFGGILRIWERKKNRSSYLIDPPHHALTCAFL